jgi:hypothetical protein
MRTFDVPLGATIWQKNINLTRIHSTIVRLVSA